jgi:hypothetical protein
VVMKIQAGADGLVSNEESMQMQEWEEDWFQNFRRTQSLPPSLLISTLFLELFLLVTETFEGGVDRETPNQLRKNWNLGSNLNDFTRPRGNLGRERAREQHGEHGGSTEGEGKNMRFHDFSDWSKIEILNQIQNNLIAKQSSHSIGGCINENYICATRPIYDWIRQHNIMEMSQSIDLCNRHINFPTLFTRTSVCPHAIG